MTEKRLTKQDITLIDEVTEWEQHNHSCTDRTKSSFESPNNLKLMKTYFYPLIVNWKLCPYMSIDLNFSKSVWNFPGFALIDARLK